MSNDRLNRVALTERLVAVGFPYEDAFSWVTRLPDEQVTHELLWHDREAQWFAAGPPASWSPAQKAEANDHYLRAHFLILLSTENLHGSPTLGPEYRSPFFPMARIISVR